MKLSWKWKRVISVDVRDFEVGYADSKEQAEGLLAYYNETNEDADCYYIKVAITEKQYRENKRGVNSGKD